MSSSQFEIGTLCIPTPFFVDYWNGYWLVVDIDRDENLEMLYITLHNLLNSRKVTIPLSDVDNYFIVISNSKWMIR